MQSIKQLRRKKGVSQTLLAEAVGVSLRTIQTYERRDANIPTKNLSKIATYFDMTIAELYLREVNEMGDAYAKRKTIIKHGSVFNPLDYGKYFTQIPLVLVEGQKNYIESLTESGLGNSPFRTGFVIEFLEDEAYKAFEVSGDSMNDGSIDAIPNKTIVLGIKTKKERFARESNSMIGKPYILVCKDRIICKQVAGFDIDKKALQCHNLNKSPEYQDFELPLEDILEIFRIVKKQF
ncbi:XRE family transcriptional regulator [Flagellimonas pacifica]|uniref:DNA-binding transcriptional regulator, XRE-family HTH domain n=1 Tax=Flagellimonas pacifica TaxID=1247520 RepID=A0A285MD41_9FLAO|nr:LexA family transcriptional regulator [Allomuricauda parva]SNY95095.1 DNA-binding transcriptional regulator, XRE-family HTH domain [Allomuricauda parva]